MNPPYLIEEIRRVVSEVLDVPVTELENNVALRQYGVDSVSTSVLADRLSALLGAPILPSLILEFPTLAELAQALAVTSVAPAPAPVAKAFTWLPACTTKAS